MSVSRRHGRPIPPSPPPRSQKYNHVLRVNVRVLHSDRDEEEEDTDEALDQGRQVVRHVEVVVLRYKDSELTLKLGSPSFLVPAKELLKRELFLSPRLVHDVSSHLESGVDALSVEVVLKGADLGGGAVASSLWIKKWACKTGTCQRGGRWEVGGRREPVPPCHVGSTKVGRTTAESWHYFGRNRMISR